MKPDTWATIKALQRAGRRAAPLDKGAWIDRQAQRRGMRPLFGTQPSRKMARRAREKGK